MRLNGKMVFLWCCLFALFPSVAEPQASAQKPESHLNDRTRNVAVPEQAAALLRPILDERQKGTQLDESRLGNLLYRLTQKKGRAADEALVVLMCFYVGESQEDTDAVIARGKRMLLLLKKYQDKNPKVPGRTYPDSMLKGISSKDDAFEGAVKAISHGWHSTSDNPEG
jgi:hypothetical protein